MKVVLAGYNVDASVIAAAVAGGVPAERLTPEVLSAAYARISRDPRPVDELRRVALEEVGKARQSNRRIIFEMGHHSVAEHAVFNFDVLGLSRLAIEALERFRLLSFTEKSQRYITLDHDFVMPDELVGRPEEALLRELVAAQVRLYDELEAVLRARLLAAEPGAREDKARLRTLEGLAKEDARYATILATSGQLGLTVNARNLELVVRRAASHPLAEVRELGRLLYEAASGVAPSLLLFTEPAPLDTEAPAVLGELAARLVLPGAGEVPAARLVSVTRDGDRVAAAALLATVSRAGFADCLDTARRLGPAELDAVFDAVFSRLEFFDAPPREFEHVQLTFEVVVSAAAFGQLKRHRMATLTSQDYDPALGLTIPPAVAELGYAAALEAHAARCAEVARALAAVRSALGAYALTNAHRRRVLFTCNLRELYHFSRLREDGHAQWDIRELAHELSRIAREVLPVSAALLGGKDDYVRLYTARFGRPPVHDPARLGGG